MLLPKPQRYKNEKYLVYIRSLPCALCGRQAEPHHENGALNERGLATKNDYLSIPLCRNCHEKREQSGVAIEGAKKLIIKLLIIFIESGRRKK